MGSSVQVDGLVVNQSDWATGRKAKSEDAVAGK